MKKYLLVDVQRLPSDWGGITWNLYVQDGQDKSNALTTRYMASGPKRFRGETRIMEYEEIGEWCEILSK